LAHPKSNGSETRRPEAGHSETEEYREQDLYFGKMKSVATDGTARTSRDELRAWVDDKLPDNRRDAPASELCSDEVTVPPANRTSRTQARQQRRLTDRLADPNTAPTFDCKPLWSTLRTGTPPDRGRTACQKVRTVDSLLVSAVTSGHRLDGNSVLLQNAWEHDAAEEAEMAELLSRRRQKQRRNSRAFEQACAVREARYRYS
jgi:hypothetical protein